MPRVLTCLDQQPAQDGSCAVQAWVEQPSIVAYLPTMEEANTIGFAFFAGLFVIAVVKRTMKPPSR